MKKTKKEKIMADLRKKIAKVENKLTYQLGEAENKSITKTPAKIIHEESKKIRPNIPTHQTKTFEVDYLQISSDLKKTIILSIFITLILFLLKILLKA